MDEQTIQELKAQKDSGLNPFIVDVRTPAEYNSGHIPGAINMPLDVLDCSRLAVLANNRSIVTVCKSGGRSKKACQQLERSGVQNAATLLGGTEAWQAAGWATEGSGAAVVSIERQVRIVAGILVLIGITGGYFIASGLYLLAAFVGAGLTFSGITDFCGMAIVLGRMPWNKSPNSACTFESGK